MPSKSNNIRKSLVELKQRVSWHRGIIVLGVIFLFAWLTMTPQGLLGKADAVGYAVCHRIDLRSFHIGDRQVPLCARCTGQYIGAMFSLIYLAVTRPRRTGRPSWVIVGFLILFAGIYTLDGLNSYIHLMPHFLRFYLYDPRNPVRLLTGTGLGLGMGVLVFPSFNATVWRNYDPRPVLDGYKDFCVLVLGGALIDLFILSENPLLIYPLALVSASGVFVLLTMIYTMVLSMITKTENGYQDLRQLSIMLIAGFLISLAQISVLDVLRYMLTGTWSGFHLG